MIEMRIKTVRLWLLFLFVASLVAHYGAFAYIYLTKAIDAPNLEVLILQILAIYSIPLSVILGALFGQDDQKEMCANPSAFYAAFVLSILWNGLLLGRTFVFVCGFAEDEHVGDLTGFLQNTSAASMFLITGALAFFFAKKGIHSEPDKKGSTRKTG
jgi:hypothetical protein